MDELVIGDKKYISSKRAAKLTGYAKDYIGQLCREGRVPARLVGRSWYVLESAIHDHRFGDSSTEQKSKIQSIPSSPPFLQSTWEQPRYEAFHEEALPSVNRLRDAESAAPLVDQKEEMELRLQNSWKEWFDRFETFADTGETGMSSPREEAPHEEIPIPIHAIYEPPPQELVPHTATTTLPKEEQDERESNPREGRMIRMIQMTGAMMAVVLVFLAVLGSGYFDEYVLSVGQAKIMAGVSVYNR